MQEFDGSDRRMSSPLYVFRSTESETEGKAHKAPLSSVLVTALVCASQFHACVCTSARDRISAAVGECLVYCGAFIYRTRELPSPFSDPYTTINSSARPCAGHYLLRYDMQASCGASPSPDKVGVPTASTALETARFGFRLAQLAFCFTRPFLAAAVSVCVRSGPSALGLYAQIFCPICADALVRSDGF